MGVGGQEPETGRTWQHGSHRVTARNRTVRIHSACVVKNQAGQFVARALPLVATGDLCLTPDP